YLRVRPGLVAGGHGFGAQADVVNPKFVNGTVQRRVATEQRLAEEEPVCVHAGEGGQAVGGGDEHAVRVKTHETGARIQHARDVQIGRVVQVAPGRDDALAGMRVHDGDAVVLAAARAEIKVVPAVVAVG